MAYYSSYNISELDKIAYAALAISYTGIYIDNPAVQDYIGKPCIAVAYCEIGLVIAANNIWRVFGPGAQYAETEIYENVGNQNIFTLIRHHLYAIEHIHIPVSFIMNPNGESDTSYHAELQLIDFMRINNYHFIGNGIGVSKPCCRICANELHRLGIMFTESHQNPTNACRPGEL